MLLGLKNSRDRFYAGSAKFTVKTEKVGTAGDKKVYKECYVKRTKDQSTYEPRTNDGTRSERALTPLLSPFDQQKLDSNSAHRKRNRGTRKPNGRAVTADDCAEGITRFGKSGERNLTRLSVPHMGKRHKRGVRRERQKSVHSAPTGHKALT